jgi:hypothetical protein|tara:strand:+ start:1091 stop:1477 length:387 start_codon:yes stop_codon:yes gene_type:complete
MTLTETTEFFQACSGITFATLGRTSSTCSYATWYGELEESGLVAIMTVCVFPTIQRYSIGVEKVERKYCFSISLGENELEARHTADICTPLSMRAPQQDDVLQDERLIHKLTKRLRWNLPVDYVDYII